MSVGKQLARAKAQIHVLRAEIAVMRAQAALGRAHLIQIGLEARAEIDARLREDREEQARERTASVAPLAEMDRHGGIE